MRTTDLGATWNRVGSPPADVSTVVSDPLTPVVLLAGGDTGIYKSTDGGQTWRRIYQFSGGYRFSAGALVIDPGNHLRLAAIVPSTSRLIRSMDGGETWTAGASPCSFPGCQLLADPTGSGALLLSASGVDLSRDWGLSFQPLRVPGGGGFSAAFNPSHAKPGHSDRSPPKDSEAFTVQLAPKSVDTENHARSPFTMASQCTTIARRSKTQNILSQTGKPKLRRTASYSLHQVWSCGSSSSATRMRQAAAVQPLDRGNHTATRASMPSTSSTE
jgi:hypothetical protein